MNTKTDFDLKSAIWMKIDTNKTTMTYILLFFIDYRQWQPHAF